VVSEYGLLSGVCLFFFSSRRRHTRLVSDWSSDVCSSDLAQELWPVRLGLGHARLEALVDEQSPDLLVGHVADQVFDVDAPVAERAALAVRLGDLRLHGNHALHTRLEIGHPRGIYRRATHVSSGRVRRRMAHRVTLIPGDGTGPELTEATRRVLEATGVELDWETREAGVEVMEEAGTPLPPETLTSIKE